MATTVTKQQVFDAADKLAAEHPEKQPTLDDVRKALRTAYATISPWFAEWKQQRNAAATPRRAPIPASMQTSAQGLAASMWDEATGLAGAQLASEREALAEAQRRLEEEKTELAQIADRLNEEIDALKATLATTTAAQQAAVAERDKIAGEMTVTATRATAAEARIAEIEARAKDLNSELQRLHADRDADRKQHTDEQNRMRADLAVAAKDRERLTGELAAATGRATTAEARAAESSTRVQAISNDLAASTKERERLAAELAAATGRATTAEARAAESGTRMEALNSELAAERKRQEARFDDLVKTFASAAKGLKPGAK